MEILKNGAAGFRRLPGIQNRIRGDLKKRGGEAPGPAYTAYTRISMLCWQHNTTSLCSLPWCLLFGCTMKLGSYANVAITQQAPCSWFTHSCRTVRAFAGPVFRTSSALIRSGLLVVHCCFAKNLRLLYRPLATSSLTHHSTKVERCVKP